MELWSAYFLVKVFLHQQGRLDFHVWPNLAFAVFTALSPANARQRLAKNLIAVPLGVMLLYFDSRLPPLLALEPMRVVSEFAFGAIDWTLVLELLALACVYALLYRKLRMSTFAFIGILLIALAPGSQLLPTFEAAPFSTAAPSRPPADLDARRLSADALEAQLASFYAGERTRQVRFAPPAPNGTPFDIVILHVASLSWDDLKAVNQADVSLFSRFDIVFSRFNSASSDSEPAAVRLLRGACGQTTEKGLTKPLDRGCSVIDGLKSADFEFDWLVNHDDRPSGIARIVDPDAAQAAPLGFDKGALIVQHASDGSPIYGDYSSLSRWLKARERDPAPRVALYYHSSSLSEGNHALGEPQVGLSADAAYARRLSNLMSDLSRFLDDLQASGRHAVVLFIADHGAALRGDRQLTGLREIPTAAIVRVPVGVALINVARPSSWTQRRIDSPTSYLAVNELLTRFLADDPFDKPTFDSSSYVDALPQTDLVAEHDGITVMQIGRHAMMRSPDGAWSPVGTSIDQ